MIRRTSRASVYIPNTNFCGLDTIRYHVRDFALDHGDPNRIVGPLDTNVATAASRSGRGCASSATLSHRDAICDPGQVNNVETESAVIKVARTPHFDLFEIEANNPCEDGVPTVLDYAISFSGIRVFAPDGHEYHSGDVSTKMVSGTAWTPVQAKIPLLVEAIRGSARPASPSTVAPGRPEERSALYGPIFTLAGTSRLLHGQHHDRERDPARRRLPRERLRSVDSTRRLTFPPDYSRSLARRQLHDMGVAGR